MAKHSVINTKWGREKEKEVDGYKKNDQWNASDSFYSLKCQQSEALSLSDGGAKCTLSLNMN